MFSQPPILLHNIAFIQMCHRAKAPHGRGPNPLPKPRQADHPIDLLTTLIWSQLPNGSDPALSWSVKRQTHNESILANCIIKLILPMSLVSLPYTLMMPSRYTEYSAFEVCKLCMVRLCSNVCRVTDIVLTLNKLLMILKNSTLSHPEHAGQADPGACRSSQSCW